MNTTNSVIPENNKHQINTSPAELELLEALIYDNESNIIAESSFIVSEEFAEQAFQKLNLQKSLAKTYHDFDSFLEEYEPGIDGHAIYQLAVKENKLIRDLIEKNI